MHVSRKQKISILVLSSAMSSNIKRNSREGFYPKIFLCLSLMIRRVKKKIRSKESAILESICVGGDLVF